DAPITFSAVPNGGIYSGTGITNTTTGEFDPATAGSNSHTIYYTYTNPTTTCINKDSLTAVVNPLPTVDFSVAPIVCINSNVNFTNNSSPIGQVTWDFGDGNTSVQTSPTHVYTADGDYTVKLIVTTPNGCIDSISKPITVYALPTANFGVTPDSLCGPLTATFQNNSTGLGVSYAWDFGNGTTSTAQNPTPITYFASNIADTTYIISLTVTNQCTAVTYVDSVKVMPKPTAIFNTNYDVFCSPWQPNFVNTSNGLPDTYSWDFGNGTTSNTSNATFSSPTYTAVGDTTFYTIMLAVSNECGVDTAYKQIAVLPHNVSAFFNTNTLEGCTPLTVNFTQYTVGGINYNWNFGDGNTSSAYSPAHTFMTAGTYQVSLAADNNCSYDTTSVTITVHAPPAIDFTFTPDSTCVYEPFQFTNQSGAMVNYQWNFGDGTTSSLSNPTHAYNASGFYTVTLTGSSTDGFCTASVTKQVYVTIPPKAQFTLNPQITCVPSTVTFTNQSTHYQYSSWDFGDGNTSAQTSPTHTYTTAGVYVVKLIVQSLNGCADTISQYVNVNPVPTA
ncbi:MAG TPA: PKD domain-containing protein, partial [Crocinitomicaceae bacterium]|nr:PKD domain-containing protein [Crocinitomicaceae bacterium]